MQYDNEASKCEVTAESVTVYRCNNVPSLGNKLLLSKALASYMLLDFLLQHNRRLALTNNVD